MYIAKLNLQLRKQLIRKPCVIHQKKQKNSNVTYYGYHVNLILENCEKFI